MTAMGTTATRGLAIAACLACAVGARAQDGAGWGVAPVRPEPPDDASVLVDLDALAGAIKEGVPDMSQAFGLSLSPPRPDGSGEVARELSFFASFDEPSGWVEDFRCSMVLRRTGDGGLLGVVGPCRSFGLGGGGWTDFPSFRLLVGDGGPEGAGDAPVFPGARPPRPPRDR